MKEALTKFAKEVYLNACEKGFHDADASRSVVDSYAVWMVNLHGEVSELWEAARNGVVTHPCDKAKKMSELGIPSITYEEEELADIIIRALDTAAARGIDIGKAVEAKHEFNKTRPHKHGGKLA